LAGHVSQGLALQNLMPGSFDRIENNLVAFTGFTRRRATVPPTAGRGRFR